MRITIVLGAFLPVPPIMGGAVEKGWFALGQEFARRGHDVVQISRAVPQFPRREIIERVRHLRLTGYDTPPSLMRLKLLDLLYSFRAAGALPASDIIVTNTFWLPVLMRGAKARGLYVHVARYPKGQMRLYRHATRLQAPSQAVADAIVAEVPDAAAKIRVIPYPRPVAQATEEPAFAPREKILLYVGRVHPEKGVHLVVEAFAQLPAGARAEWRLRIVGPTDSKHGGGGVEYAERLRQLAAPANGNVELAGPVFDAAALERAFRSATLFIYPSLAERGETFGLAPLEAMAHGCPVLVSDLGCFHDFVRENDTGFFFNHRAADPVAALRDRLAELMTSQSLPLVGESGFRQAEQFTLPEVAGQFLSDFEAVLAEQQNGRATNR